MTRARRKQWTLPALCGLFLTLACVTQAAFTRAGVANGYMADASARGGTPTAVALAHAGGEFRIVVANVLWMNVLDHYHHQYMAQGGVWAKNQDVLPLIHVIVTLDPHFTQAYDVGWLILAELRRYDEASQMLEQGIANNGSSWELEYDMAMLHAWYQKDAKTALPYAERAYQVATDPFYKRRLSIFIHTLRTDVEHPKQLASATAVRR